MEELNHWTSQENKESIDRHKRHRKWQEDRRSKMHAIYPEKKENWRQYQI